MVVSFLRRRTSITDREQWRSRVEALLPRLRPVLERQPGFLSVQHLWAADGIGDMVEVTIWESAGACRDYVRGGGAALAATISDAVLPTADYPHGAWVRETYEVG